MRSTTLIFAVLCAGTAHAQFANRSFGGGVSFVKFIGGDVASGLNFAGALTLEGSLYIDSGFELYAQVPLSVVDVATGADNPGNNGRGQVFGTGGHLGARYLFLEETIRPYVGLEFATFVLITVPDPKVIFGPGLSGGIQWFVADSISIGANANFNVFFELNKPVRPAFGGGLNFGAYF
jgi:outer membrane protein